MKRILLLCYLFCISNIVQAQDSTDHCGTANMDTTEFKQLPWFDKNDLLENFLDSIGYPNGKSRIIEQGVRYWIPVKFWIYRDDDGNGGPTLREIRDLIDDLNRFYNQLNNTQIGFYLKCEPTYINNSTHVTKTLAGAALLIGGTNRDYGCINVHVVDRIRQNVVGMAIKPTNGLIISRAAYTTSKSTLAHEMGHIFGLVHTHLHSALNIRCFTESVSRTRDWAFFNLCFKSRKRKVCESTGDALRDTNADPNLSDNDSCDYIRGKHDPWGDSYQNPPNGLQERPDPSNIMSYNQREDCINRFSRLQIAVMLRTIIWEKALVDQQHWRDARYTFDSFEPDNNGEMSRLIGLNETQERNFHQQYNRDAAGFFPNTTQCDLDWVRFVAPCTNILDITTSAMAGRTNANTKLTLYNSSLTQLAQNDNISGTNLFSKITFSFTAGQEYFIRVENISPGTTGYYSLTVGNNLNAIVINGSSNVCPSGTPYSLSSLPAGYSVNWSTIPANYATFNPATQSSTIATPIAYTNFAIVATLTGVCTGGVPYTIQKNVTGGSGNISGTYNSPTNPAQLLISHAPKDLTTFNAACIAFATTMSLPAEATVSWSGSTSSPDVTWYQSGNDIFGNFTAIDQTAVFTLSVTTSCGTTTTRYRFKCTTLNSWGISPLRVGLSPNPASGDVSVSLQEKGNKNKTKDIFEIRIIDKLGNIKQTIRYGKNQHAVLLNVANLPTDIYTIMVFDGNVWTAAKLSKQ